jgi:amidophosphoribosyltransferase
MKAIVIFLCFLFSYFSLHGCGIAFIRLKKPLSYYQEKYGDAKWGLFKLMVLMDRQRNRGQDSAGIAVAGMQRKGIFIDRDLSLDALFERFSQIEAGTLLLGHLRYNTSGYHDLMQCHPLVHQEEDPRRTFALAGNFNLTNKNAISGIHNELSDTFAILKTLAESYKGSPLATLKDAAPLWDGGYVLCQIYADTTFIVCRDPNGIRPGFFFQNDELLAIASEKSALADTFDIDEKNIDPIPPGHALQFSELSELEITPFIYPAPAMECVFERIYFSKGNSSEIYNERKELGRQLAPRVWDEIQGDLTHTIFTYVPNASQAAFLGLTEQIDQLHKEKIKEKLLEKSSLDEIQLLLKQQVRNEMLIHKNQKMRTFISPDAGRKQRVSQLYETTQNIVTSADTLVVIDDSIVRGVTLKDSLMKKLITLNPKKIVIVSSSPPVRFPDCYGIDMSQIGRLIAFQAAVKIFKEKNGCDPMTLSQIYDSCTFEEIEHEVAQLIIPENSSWTGEVKVIFQSLEGLAQAIPFSKGQWVFTGQYPTHGGFKTLQTSFDNWRKRDDSRSY